MKVLVTGRGTSGSWQIRGAQLGHAIGATVEPNAADADGFDVAVVVKRPSLDLVQRIHKRRVPLVWDIVDAWPQPLGNNWRRNDCMAWLRQQVAQVKPAGIVAATRAMAKDCEEFGVPVLALPHHSRPGLRRAPIRPFKTVGYEGGPQYIGRWFSVIAGECARRRLSFDVNPYSLEDVDVVLALRDEDGYAPRHWKSNVKLANAQALGLPAICAREFGYIETASGAEKWADTPAEFIKALDELESPGVRQKISDKMHAAAISLDSVATTYKQWLRECFPALKS